MSACVWWGSAALLGDRRGGRRRRPMALDARRRAAKRDADTKHYNNKWAAPGGVLHYTLYT